METSELVALIIKLGVGALATFGAILLWSQTRDSAWMLIIIGAIVNYGEIIYATFYLFGILQRETLVLGLPLIRILLANLPSLFYLLGFIVAISKTRLR